MLTTISQIGNSIKKGSWTKRTAAMLNGGCIRLDAGQRFAPK